MFWSSVVINHADNHAWQHVLPLWRHLIKATVREACRELCGRLQVVSQRL
jgi:hypothetical protein